MFDFLNTREWALLMCGLIALAIILRNPSVRQAANGIEESLTLIDEGQAKVESSTQILIDLVSLAGRGGEL